MGLAYISGESITRAAILKKYLDVFYEVKHIRTQ